MITEKSVDLFSDLGLNQSIFDRLQELGFVSPTPIQGQSLPHSLDGRDVIGKAETGTGKTLAFCLPILQKLDADSDDIQALILSPTRELAKQIQDTLAQFEDELGFKSISIIGGESQAKQIMKLHRGVSIVVGTPGRVYDMLTHGSLKLGNIDTLVLDEADRMLDMGFIQQVESIMSLTPSTRQTLLFSATVDNELKRISKRHMKDSVLIETSQGLKTSENIDQKYVVIARDEKIQLLTELLDVSRGIGTIVFANTKRIADMIGKELWVRGYKALHLHGDIEQDIRENVLAQFRSGECDILVATDVAQRGLDVDRVERVINYEVPNQPESYVHRIGRCGRAGRNGTVLTMVDPKQKQEFFAIKKKVGDLLVELPTPGHYRNVDLNRSRSSHGRGSDRRSYGGGRSNRGNRSGGSGGRRQNGNRGRHKASARRR